MLPLKRPAIALKRRTGKIMRAASVSSTATSSWEQVRQESRAPMTEAERAEYDTAAIEAEARLQLAELVDNTPRSAPRTEN